jgi:hypothetical protein
MKYLAVMASYGMIYIPSFMKTCTDVQAILTLYLRHVNGCNVGIPEEKGL